MVAVTLGKYRGGWRLYILLRLPLGKAGYNYGGSKRAEMKQRKRASTKDFVLAAVFLRVSREGKGML